MEHRVGESQLSRAKNRTIRTRCTLVATLPGLHRTESLGARTSVERVNVLLGRKNRQKESQSQGRPVTRGFRGRKELSPFLSCVRGRRRRRRQKNQVSRSEKREGLSYLSSFRLGKIPSIEKREARGALLSLLLSTWKNTEYREARSERGSLISPPFNLEKYQVSRKRETRGALLSLLLSTWKNTKYRESEKREGLLYLFFFRLGKIPSIEKARSERGSCISSSFDFVFQLHRSLFTLLASLCMARMTSCRTNQKKRGKSRFCME